MRRRLDCCKRKAFGIFSQHGAEAAVRSLARSSGKDRKRNRKDRPRWRDVPRDRQAREDPFGGPCLRRRCINFSADPRFRAFAFRRRQFRIYPAPESNDWCCFASPKAHPDFLMTCPCPKKGLRVQEEQVGRRPGPHFPASGDAEAVTWDLAGHETLRSASLRSRCPRKSSGS